MPSSHLQLVREQPPDPTLDEIVSRPGAHGVFSEPAQCAGWTRVIVMDRARGLVLDSEVLTVRLSAALIEGLALYFLGSASPAAQHRSVG